MRVIDLTHPISHSLPVYFPWHPPTELIKTATFAEHKCEVTRVSIGTHSGTHIDAPRHVYEDAPTLDQYDPSLWFVEAEVLDFTPREPRKEITAHELKAKMTGTGVGIIVKTGWDVQFGKPDYYQTYPPLTREAAELLVQMNVPVLAADTPFTMDVHYVCLKKGMPLVTNLNNTSHLKEGRVKLIAAPLLIAGGDGAPARVLAVVD
jgi:kynurenine formamidase